MMLSRFHRPFIQLSLINIKNVRTIRSLNHSSLLIHNYSPLLLRCEKFRPKLQQQRTLFTTTMNWKRMKKPSIFFIGFASMSLLIVIEFFYDKFRRSGLTLKEYLSSLNDNKSNLNDKIIIDNDNETGEFRTKYASLVNKNEIPEIKPSRIIPGTIKLNDLKLTLYQYQNCPFCSKVRTFLDYYGLPYEIVEVNPVMRQQIRFSKHYRKVPILLIDVNVDGNSKVLQINDSTLIISALNSYLLSKNPKSKHNGESIINIIRWYLNSQVFFNELENESNDNNNSSTTYSATKSNVELINRYFLMIGDIDETKYERIDSALALDRRWRRWVNDHLVHILSPNIYRTIDESYQSFYYFSNVSEWNRIFSKWEIYIITNVGALAMYFIGKRLKKKYQLKDDVRQSLYDSCNYWLKSIGTNHKFMGGQQPSLSDLTVYGVLSSIEGCEAFNDLLQNTRIKDWYYSMKLLINQHYGSKQIQHLFN